MVARVKDALLLYVSADNMYFAGHSIPIWMFGFLY